MKERPILFNGDMVRAILDGRKTVTRRVVKRDYAYREGERYPFYIRRRDAVWDSFETIEKLAAKHCPYGAPGDRLWVRETIVRLDTDPWDGNDVSVYRADHTLTPLDTWPWKRNTLASIHCPRGLSRIDLEVTGVRVERVQEITEEDAMAEGVWDGESYTHDHANPEPMRKMFAELWDNINAKRGYGWENNPWVWIIEFRRINP